ncbi:MoaD family protein [Haladaptatus sp. F3-133]|jgi:molybdopterin synthase sulfur carrier subunit|uniref:MoaD family protein n=1 Tax=Halorutilus salinus TaxID=2487751 RepID=A0A9Q4C2F4_9EURY|nr:ubiquitin-like small modifier protein 1 [Halorutilus salinus]MCX2817811.1 MoaD family protein [Halorutilus salinus]
MTDVRFSSALESVTDERTTEVDAETVGEALDELAGKYGDEFEERLLDDGELRRFVNLYVNGDDVRHGEGLDTEVDDDDEISILPAVSGGS